MGGDGLTDGIISLSAIVQLRYIKIVINTHLLCADVK